MERLHRELKDQGLAMLAIDVGEGPEPVARFMKELGLTFPTALDEDMEVAVRYRLRGLPTTVLIDRDGRMIGQVVGGRNWASPEARALVRSLLDRGG